MRQDVYRVALDEAHAELIGISKRFEELRSRKETLETVVAALSPMLRLALAQNPDSQQRLAAQQTSDTPAPQPQSMPEPEASVEPPSYTFTEVPAPLPDESITDPFQRRVRNALRFSNGNGNGNNGHDRRGLQPAV